MRRLITTFAILVVPSVAWSCAVCTDGEKQNAMAFFWTTVLLTLLPLGMLGFLIRWVQRKATNAQQPQNQAELRNH